MSLRKGKNIGKENKEKDRESCYKKVRVWEKRVKEKKKKGGVAGDSQSPREKGKGEKKPREKTERRKLLETESPTEKRKGGKK